jgi:two-component system, OmpR family, sensor histidine kinase CpxA
MKDNRRAQFQVSLSMWSLIVKILVCYWIAAGIVIAVSDAVPHGELHRQEAIRALTAALQFESRSVLAAYQSGGCAAALPLMEGTANHMFLASPNGSILCGQEPGLRVQSLIAEARNSKVPVAIDHTTLQMLAVPATSPNGQQFMLLLEYRIPRFLWFWPGPTTMEISGVVTLFLAILIAVPIRRLSSAAQHIANGQLDARVLPGKFPKLLALPFEADIIQSLIADFNHMASRLQILVDAQRTFLRDVSHELRSPLARLSVALELAREAGDPNMGASLNRIGDEAARVDDLIAQLLSLSHMEDLTGIKSFDAVSLGDLVAKMMPDIEYEANGRRCRVIANAPHDCFVLGDGFLLQRAFENVVRNAIRYTPEEGTIEIDVEKLERNGNWLAILRICDSGPGVPVDELQRILLPFHRVDKSRQRSTGGFGVGLAIADRAVKLHAGQIVAWNKPTGGLIVEMSFPLAYATC